MFRSYRDTIRTPVKASKEAARKYFCDLCDDGEQHIGWDLELDAEIHRRRVHKVELIQLMREPKNYMCSVCLRKQQDKASLIAHIKKHHLLTPADASYVKRDLFICDYCGNIFFNKLLLIAHIRYFHLLTIFEKRTAKTQCPSCFKNVNIRSIWFHFLYHGIIHTGTCPICLSTFDNYNEALRHIDSHPGFYSCNICPYESKKESLFQNHLDKHKKTVNLDGRDDVNSVAKYYVPQRRAASWNRKFLNIFKGITLAPELQICILCRSLCETDEQMMQHIYGDHSPVNEVEIKRHICVCGEEFFNSVLLKHHIFTLKGDHKAYDATVTPIAKRKRIEPENTPEKHQRKFGVEIEVKATLGTDNETYKQQPKTDQQIVYMQANDDSVPIEKTNTLPKKGNKSNIQATNTLLRKGNKSNIQATKTLPRKGNNSNIQATTESSTDQQMMYLTYSHNSKTVGNYPRLPRKSYDKKMKAIAKNEQMLNHAFNETASSKTLRILNKRSNKIPKQIVSNISTPNEQMVYIAVNHSSEVTEKPDSSIIKQTNETSKPATPTEPMLYLSFNHNSDTPNQNNTHIIRIKNETMLNKQNPSANNTSLLRDRIILANDTTVTTNNETVFQMSDDRAPVAEDPNMFVSDRQYYEEVISSQDNEEPVCDANHSEETGYISGTSQQEIVYQIHDVAAEAKQGVDRIIVDESMLFS